MPDLGLQQMLIGNDPRPLWKRLMQGVQGRKRPSTTPRLPTVVVSGVDSRARQSIEQDRQIRAADSLALARAGLPVREGSVQRVRSVTEARGDALFEVRTGQNRRSQAPEPRTMERFARESDLSPFVRDTVTAIAGGRPQAITFERQGYPGAIASLLMGTGKWISRENPPGGHANPLSHTVSISSELSPQSADQIATHEIGHIADFRGNLPGFDQIAARHFREVPSGQYASANPTEYKAVLFERALDLIHQGNSASWDTPREGDIWLRTTQQQEERNLPGLSEAVGTLLAHPMLAETPMGRLQRQRLNELIGLHSTTSRR